MDEAGGLCGRELVGAGIGGGAMTAGGVGRSSDKVKLGTGIEGGSEAVALGVVCSSSGTAMVGGGGGGSSSAPFESSTTRTGV